MNQRKMIVIAALVGLLPSLARAALQVNKFIGCPGRSITIYSNVKAVEERVCVKVVSDLTNERRGAEFWNHTFGGQKDFGRKNGFVCFRTDLGRNEFRAGAFDTTTALYVLVDDPKINHQIYDGDIERRIVPTSPQFASTGQPYDQCKARCEQTPAPTQSAANDRNGCFMTCGASGDWIQSGCSKLGTKDRNGVKIINEN